MHNYSGRGVRQLMVPDVAGAAAELRTRAARPDFQVRRSRPLQGGGPIH